MTDARTTPAARRASAVGRAGARPSRHGVLRALLLALLLGTATTPAAQAAPDGGHAAVDPAGVAAAPPTTPGPWTWPLAGEPVVVRPFTAPAQRWSPGHRGVDLASTPGAPVLSPASGRVVLARRVVDRGVVVLEHPGGLRTTLEPVEGVLAVGTAVARGDVVGRVAAEGAHCPGCLHWGMRRGTGRTAAYLDPLSLLAPPAPPVLLPLTPRSPPG